jgi:hypothetical protein
MDLTILAAEAARFFFMKASEGAITKVGGDALTKLYKLKGIIQDWLQANGINKEASETPEMLQAEIIEEFATKRNDRLKQELEDLVRDLKQAETNSVNAYQRNVYGSNQAMRTLNGDAVGRDKNQTFLR